MEGNQSSAVWKQHINRPVSTSFHLQLFLLLLLVLDHLACFSTQSINFLQTFQSFNPVPP